MDAGTGVGRGAARRLFQPRWGLLVFMAGLAGVLQAAPARACEGPVTVCERGAARDFPLIQASQPAAVFVAADADPALQHVATAFAEDLQRVSGKPALRIDDLSAVKGPVVIITEADSELVQTLVRAGTVDVQPLIGQWEAYLQQVVHAPLPGITQALLIVGADRRGAVFGAFDLSRRIGVSPWHWFADVPVAQRAAVFVTPGIRIDQPAVKNPPLAAGRVSASVASTRTPTVRYSSCCCA